MSGGKKFYSKIQRWFDELKLAFYGAILATKKKRFLIPFFVIFFVFGMLLNQLTGGTAAFSLLAHANFGGKIMILRDAFLGIFGVNRNFIDWFFIFFMSLLQATILSLVIFVYKYRKDSTNLQNAGIITGLIVLSSGCPTCGTTILAPVLVSIAGSSGMAMVGTVSWILTLASIVIALFAFKKVGFETYAIIMEERYKKKKGTKDEN